MGYTHYFPKTRELDSAERTLILKAIQQICLQLSKDPTEPTLYFFSSDSDAADPMRR
jgi:hypothetical protein